MYNTYMYIRIGHMKAENMLCLLTVRLADKTDKEMSEACG
jgi:hypothetical protein